MLSASSDERESALDLLDGYRNLKTLGNKGFLDQFRQAWEAEPHGNWLWTPKRRNQQEQNPQEWDALDDPKGTVIEPGADT